MSEVIRNNVFKDLFVYETTGLDDKSLGFIGRLSRIRGKDLTSTLNFLIHSCEKGYEKKFAAAQANFAPNAWKTVDRLVDVRGNAMVKGRKEIWFPVMGTGFFSPF